MPSKKSIDCIQLRNCSNQEVPTGSHEHSSRSPTYLPSRMAKLPPRCAPKNPPNEKMEAMVDHRRVSTLTLSSARYRCCQVSLRNLWMCWKTKEYLQENRPDLPVPIPPRGYMERQHAMLTAQERCAGVMHDPLP